MNIGKRKKDKDIAPKPLRLPEVVPDKDPLRRKGIPVELPTTPSKIPVRIPVPEKAR